MAGESQKRDVDDADGPFTALVDWFDASMTAFPDLDYLDVVATVTVLVLLVGIWGYSLLS